MSREEAIRQLKLAQASLDTEAAHCSADEVLCELLESLGFSDVVDAWKEVSKWYA